MNTIFTRALLAPLLLLAACGGETELPRPEAGPKLPVVYAVNYPLAWMAESLAGSLVQVRFPAPPEVDPAYWEPDVETVLQYQQGDLLLLSGANYARWVATVSLPGDTLRDTSVSYRDRLIGMDSGPVHSHGPGGEHSHGETAFTTWLDMELAQLQLQSVAVALAELLPDESAADIAVREKETIRLLADMDNRLMAIGAELAGEPLLYSHPVYQYLDRRYRLNGRALHWEPGEMPSEEQWNALQALLQSHPARLMLWEDQPLSAVTDQLASLGVEIVVYSPLGNRPAEGDFASGMEGNIQRLRAAVDALPQGSG
jgi:zinc transport system substrate-binding protein